ncbi:MAG TPA: alpha/beta hydrolase [Candidatus Thermoplasmatota archaeon]|nr:alpha/beta hydrolase [Candidatus Thermoplasmatota archaeon]
MGPRLRKRQGVALARRRSGVGPWTIHYRYAAGPPEARSRPPLVLVHGLIVSSRYMIPTAEALGTQYRVFVPDLPGYGWSTKPREVLSIPQLADALAQWMKTEQVGPAVVLGNSMGCQIAVDLATRYPDLVEGLILVGPTMDRHARSWWRQVGRLLRDSAREPLGLLVTETLDFWQMGPRRALRTSLYAVHDPIEAKLPQVHAPAIVVRGDRDVIVPDEWAREVAALLPAGEFTTLPGPHVLNWVQPQGLRALVDAFTAALAPRGLPPAG